MKYKLSYAETPFEIKYWKYGCPELLKECIKEHVIDMEFVTYKIGKKLQDKGYLHGYNRFGYRPIYSDEYTINYVIGLGAYKEEYYGENIPCPTISQVLKWLREEKEIFIIVEPFPTTATKNKICWCWHYKWNSDGVYMDSTFPDDLDYMTYEKSALAGIEYALDNLI